MPPPPSGGGDDARLTSVCLMSVAYIGPKSRTERPRNTKIGTEVAHVTRDSDITFKVKRSRVNLQGAGHIVAASRTACLKNRSKVTHIQITNGMIERALHLSRWMTHPRHWAHAHRRSCSSIFNNPFIKQPISNSHTLPGGPKYWMPVLLSTALVNMEYVMYVLYPTKFFSVRSLSSKFCNEVITVLKKTPHLRCVYLVKYYCQKTSNIQNRCLVKR